MASANTQQQDAVSDEFDYETWAATAKTTLIEKGLWDIVENGVPPDPSKIPELAAKLQPEEWRDLAAKDTKALQILQSSLADSAFRNTLSSASSAKEVWDSLQKGNEETTIHWLEKQFEELSMDENESVDSYLDRVLEVLEQLRLKKIEKSDYQICKKVFTSLSGSYDGRASMLEELIDVHKMTSQSLIEYFCFHGYKSVTEEDIFSLLKDLRLKPTSDKWCGLCYKNNHNQADCNFRFRIDEEEELIVEYCLLTPVTLGEKTYDEDVWMVYREATNHMTPYEKYFTTLDRTHKAKVGLADGTLLLVEGRGDVKIKMKGGKKKTIKNVIFVPELNRNVLSLSQMISRAYSFTEGSGGECIIRDRTGVEFGESTWKWVEKELALRLQVIVANHTS